MPASAPRICTRRHGRGRGFSITPWTPDQTANSLTWSTETFAQNPNANAIRWGTLYNFRFDSDSRRRLPMQRSVSSRQAPQSRSKYKLLPRRDSKSNANAYSDSDTKHLRLPRRRCDHAQVLGAQSAGQAHGRSSPGVDRMRRLSTSTVLE